MIRTNNNNFELPLAKTAAMELNALVLNDDLPVCPKRPKKPTLMRNPIRMKAHIKSLMSKYHQTLELTKQLKSANAHLIDQNNIQSSMLKQKGDLDTCYLSLSLFLSLSLSLFLSLFHSTA